MGWWGYGIYDGDDTQTCHINFLKNSGINIETDFIRSDAFDDKVYHWMSSRGTRLPSEVMQDFVKNIDKVLKKMPKLYRGHFRHDDDAIEWQMLLSLFVDNKTVPSKEIYEMGVSATNYLMGEHADAFNSPGIRRKSLRNFLKKAENIYKGKKPQKKSGKTKKVEIKKTFIVEASDYHEFPYIQDHLKAAGLATGYYEIHDDEPYKAVFYLKGYAAEAKKIQKEMEKEAY